MHFRSFALAFALCVTTLAARADTFTYTYTGKHFTTTDSPYTTRDAVTGSLTLATELRPSMSYQTVTPLSFSFSDGVKTFGSDYESSFQFSTDASGDITNWLFTVHTDMGGSLSGSINSYNTQSSVFDEGRGETYRNVEMGSNSNSPGTWTERINVTSIPSAATPEPPSLSLLLSGGLGLAGALYRNRRRQ